MHRFTFVLLSLVSAHEAIAAPPTVDYLFPAGGQRGTVVDVSVGGKFEHWPIHAWTSDKSLDIRFARESGKLHIAIAADAEPGTRWIRLYNADGAGNLRPFLVGTVPEQLEKEPNDDPLNPQALNASSLVVNGRLDRPGDVDVFLLSLKKGQTLVAALDAYHSLRSPMDAVMQILSSDGIVLEQNHDYRDFDPLLAFTAPVDGSYHVRLFAFPSVPNSAIRLAGAESYVYRLTLTTAGFVEHAYPLAVPLSKPGAIELVGWNIPPQLRTLPVPARPEPGMVTLFHPHLANAAAVQLVSHAAVAESMATRDQPQPLALPVVISGRIDRPGEIDFYQFDGKKGQKLDFRIEARTLGFLLDPVLTVHDAGRKLLKQEQAKSLNGDPSLEFVVPQDGKYLLEVRDAYKNAGRRHVYRLWAGAAIPGFDLKVASDRFTLMKGKPLDVPITIERQGGFKDAVAFTIEGLPEGVSAVSTPTPKTISLRLSTAMTEPFFGPIRIVGTATSDRPLRRRARANIAELGVATTDLWLTVAAVK